MKKENIKIIAVSVLGIIVIILSILGISKYRENNSIDIHFGPGGGSDGGKSGNERTKKGKFLKCIQYKGDFTTTFYVEFKNNKFYKMVQYKIDAEVPADYMNKHSKKEIEADLASYFICSKDKDYALCGNLKFKWNNRNVTLTFGIDMSPLHKEAIENNENYLDMTMDEFLTYIEKQGYKNACEKVSKAPIYATKADPKGTYYNKYKNISNSISAKNEIKAKDKPKEVEEISKLKTTENCTNSQLTFTTVSAKYNEDKNGLTYIVTNVKNNSSKDCKLGNFNMDIKDQVGGTISIEKGYSSELIKAGNTVTIKNSIGFDITGRYSRIDYIIG